MKNSDGLMNEPNSVRIIYDCKDFVVAEKPHGMPTAPLKENEKDTALEAVLELFPQGREVYGKKAVEHGLVHRLDTATHGLFIVALNQSAFDILWAQQQSGNFIKGYTAYCTKQPDNSFSECDFVLKNGLEISSYFRYFGKNRAEVRPVNLNGTAGRAAEKKAQDKVYSTFIENVSKVEFENVPEAYKGCSVYKVQCTLKSGFKHQIRAHLAWTGFPIIGDNVYCPAAKKAFAENSSVSIKLELHAYSLSFINPKTSENCSFEIKPIPSFLQQFPSELYNASSR